MSQQGSRTGRQGRQPEAGRQPLAAYFQARSVVNPSVFMLPGETKRRAARTRMHVWQAIAGYANPDGTNAYPSQRTLAEQSMLSDRSIRTIITDLEVLGLVERQYKASRTGANCYTVLLPPEVSGPGSEGFRVAERGPGSERGLHPEVNDVDPEVNDVDPEVNDVDPEVWTSYDRRPSFKPKERPTRTRRASHSRSSVSSARKELLNDLVNMANGEVTFDAAQSQALARLTEQYTGQELREAFKEYYGRVEGDAFALKHAGKKFVEQAGQLVDFRRRQRKEREEQEALLARMAEEGRKRALEEIRLAEEAAAAEAEFTEDTL